MAPASPRTSIAALQNVSTSTLPYLKTPLLHRVAIGSFERAPCNHEAETQHTLNRKITAANRPRRRPHRFDSPFLSDSPSLAAAMAAAATASPALPPPTFGDDNDATADGAAGGLMAGHAMGAGAGVGIFGGAISRAAGPGSFLDGVDISS